MPCTQSHAEFEVALRGCSRDANDDHSRIRTATRSNCSFLCIFIRQVARLVQTRQLLAKVVLSQRSSHPGSRVAFLTGDFDPGTFHRYSFQWPDAPGEDPTLSVGSPVPRNQKNPSRTLNNSVTCSPDSTLCLGTSPRFVI